MKSLTSLLCLLLVTLSFGQDPIKLELDNYHPRVGEEITLSFPLAFIDAAVDKSMDDLQDDMKETEFFRYRENNSYKKNFAFDKPGEYTVGPFEFFFNGSSYSTDSITITVIEDLPFEEGVWIRLEEENGKQFLIIEQYSENLEVEVYNREDFMRNQGSKAQKTDFADLKEKTIDGVTFSVRNTSTMQRSENENDFRGPKLTYRYRKYEINFEFSLTEKLVLTKKNFQSFPKKITFENIEIDRPD